MALCRRSTSQTLDFGPPLGTASPDWMRRAPLRPGGDENGPATAWPPDARPPVWITAPDHRAAETAARAAAGLLPSLDDQIRTFLVDLGYHRSTPPRIALEGPSDRDEWDIGCPHFPVPEFPAEADFLYKALYVEAYEVRNPGLRHSPPLRNRGMAQRPSAKSLGRGYVTGTPANRFWRTDGWQLDHAVPHPPWLPAGPPVPSSADPVMVEALRRLGAPPPPVVAGAAGTTAGGAPFAWGGECLNVTQGEENYRGIVAPSSCGSSDSEYAAGYAQGYADGWDDYEDGDTGANEPARGDGDPFDDGAFAGYYDAWHDAVGAFLAPGSGSEASSDRECTAGSAPGSGSESSSDRECTARSAPGSGSESSDE